MPDDRPPFPLSPALIAQAAAQRRQAQRCLSRGFLPAGAFALALALALLLAISPPVMAQAGDPDQVVAMVEGEEIRLAEVEAAFALLPPQYQEIGFPALYPQLLERMIQRHAVTRRARDAGIADDPDYRAQLALIEAHLMHDVYLRREVAARADEDMLRAEYATWQEANPGQEEIDASHILLETREEAENIIRMAAGGGDFAELAREHSTGPSGPSGGNLGWFTRGRMVPAFEEAAFALAPGGISETPVETDFGWHVIRLNERRMQPQPSFSEMKPMLLEQFGRDAALAIAAEAVTEVAVERFDLQGQAMAAPAPAPAPAP